MTNVLVVDDERDAADSLTMLFGALGHRTMAAYNGLEALEVSGLFHPDVVILDIEMPLMDGFQAARLLRERGSATRPVLVALTAWVGDDIAALTNECGFDLCMAKPANLATLKAIVEQPRFERGLHDDCPA